MKVLISDKTSEKGIDVLRNNNIKVDINTGLPEEELIKIINVYDGLIVRSQTKVTARIIAAADNLKIIGRAGVGVDNIDIAAATKKGIIVVNSPEGNTIAAAEHSIAMLLSMARNIPMAYASLKEKKWDRSKYTGVEVYGKTLGIIGLGKIGSRVAKYGVGMGMKVIGYDPFTSKEYAKQLCIELVDINDIFTKSDFISLHLPKTSETENLINAETFKSMKDGVCIVNCARGGIVNEQDLLDAVNSGKVASAAVDVYSKEPAEADNPVLQSDKIVFTPHLGASTKEAQVNVAIDVAEQIAEVLQGGIAKSAVNIPAMKPEKLAPVSKFLLLSEKLGKLASQLVADSISEIRVKYCGEFSAHDVAPLTTSFLKGFLEFMVSETVNYVNAPLILKERGVKITESKTENIKDFANLLTVEVISSDGKSRKVEGSYFDSIGDMIVSIDGYRINAIPKGYLLVVPNQDCPGVIGEIGSFLGKHNVNIAGMNVGRISTGGNAIMVINVDSSIKKDVLAGIRNIKGIIGEAKLVKF